MYIQNTSVDAVASVRDYCKKAVELGLKEFCITNHHELWSVDDGTYDSALTEEKIGNLQKEIEQASKEFGISIKHGIELGYYEGRQQEVKRILEKHSFDFVIGSVHIVDGIRISGEKVQLDVDKNEMLGRYKRYFQLLKQAIEFEYFDCVGHIDLPRKEMPQLDFNEYKDMVAECIQAMKKKTA